MAALLSMGRKGQSKPDKGKQPDAQANPAFPGEYMAFLSTALLAVSLATNHVDAPENSTWLASEAEGLTFDRRHSTT